MLLTDQERHRFADWLEMEARSGEEIAAQTEKVGGMPMELMSKHLRTEAAAMRLIARKLRNTESQVIG